jgi:hypothetical protein
MSKNTFTPGPWRIDTTTGSNMQTVYMIETENGDTVARTDRREFADMILALPDLLAALEEWRAHKFVRPISDHPEAVEQRRIYYVMLAAIAKARGQWPALPDV